MRGRCIILGLTLWAAMGCDDDNSAAGADAQAADEAVAVDQAEADAQDPGPGGDLAVEADAAPDAGPPDWPALAPPDDVTLGTVRRHVVWVDGVAAPPNPTTGEATPPELNRVRVLSYAPADGTPPEALIVTMPGFLGGAMSFDGTARALVEEAAAQGMSLEVQVIDRRANLLEDLRGMLAADVGGDGAIARAYYRNEGTVGGRSFEGLHAASEVSFMSEWGLAVHLGDLRNVIALVPEARRRGHVFLMGHSFGTAISELYAAWRFADGRRGAEDLAGLILLDGSLPAAIDEAAWRTDGVSLGIASVPGVDKQRAEGPRFAALPLLGAEVLVNAQILGLSARFAPDAVVDDPEFPPLYALLFGGAPMPALTARTALALVFDDDSSPLGFARATLGALDGPAERYQNIIASEELLRPSDATRAYAWRDAFTLEPPEYTPITLFSEIVASGPTNFYEWYFPTRLLNDVFACGSAAVPEDGWQATEGLRAFDGPLDDAPILSFDAALISGDAMAAIAGRVAPTVGEGRPNAGARRDDPRGFELVDVNDMAHLDMGTAPRSAQNVIPPKIVAFVRANAEPGPIE
ncbi:MAG: hypothetical protein KC620_01610 [Myxococcales bacterium]|nr:hypothetical protein [Myxococcales bacterium]